MTIYVITLDHLREDTAGVMLCLPSRFRSEFPRKQKLSHRQGSSPFSDCNVSTSGDLSVHAALQDFDFEPREPSFLMWSTEREQSHN